MVGLGWSVARSLLHKIDAEAAHLLTLRALESLPLPKAVADDPRLSIEAFGLSFPNPVGLAAGFDKDARVPDAMLRLGFGFVEVGSVTPRAQEGNPKPRIFRLEEESAVVNRLGFNNEGHAAAQARLEARRGLLGIVGVNVGANKDSTDRAGDYAAGIAAFADLAAYLTINVSSPNTEGLRDLQARQALDNLLARTLEARNEAVSAGKPRRPILLKISPDLSRAELDDVAEVALRRGVDGLIVSNTTLTRPGLRDSRLGGEAGGLSGPPLFRRATWMLAETFLRVGSRLPLVGAGGIDSGAAALAKIRSGASLIQVYTALVYEGPALVAAIKHGLLRGLDEAGAGSIAALTGRDADAVAREGPG